MIFLKLYRFFVGKVRVSAEGIFAERILNLCAHNGITVWAIRRKGDKLLFYMSVRDFFALRKIIRGVGIRVHIIKKRGWPFIVRRYKQRYGLFIGAFIFFTVLHMLSGYVWNINISGNQTVEREKIIQVCNELGIREGVRVSSLDPQKLRLEIVNRIDDLAWAAVNIEGSILTVEVTEAEKKDENDGAPCNLCASADGIIRKIEVEHGKTMVSVGDSVASGDLLVSGVFEYKNGTTAMVASEGVIIAEVGETYSATVPLTQEINVLSGEVYSCKTLSIFGLKIPLYLGDYGDGYLRDEKIEKIEANGAYLPFYMHETQFRRVEKQTVFLSNEQAAAIAKEELDKKIEDYEIISKNEKIIENKDSITVTYDIVSLRDIAIKEKILFNTTN